MKVTVNGEDVALDENATVSTMLDTLGFPEKGMQVPRGSPTTKPKRSREP